VHCSDSAFSLGATCHEVYADRRQLIDHIGSVLTTLRKTKLYRLLPQELRQLLHTILEPKTSFTMARRSAQRPNASSRACSCCMAPLLGEAFTPAPGSAATAAKTATV
jgi:hypothetical protein